MAVQDEDLLMDEEAADEEYSEAEHRLALAAFYRQLMKGELFTEDSEEAQQVASEVKQFARERMNVLIGIQGEVAPSHSVESPFSDMQVSALQQLADRIIARESGEPPEPAPVKRVEPPAAIKKAVPPQVKPVAAPVRRPPPSMKKVTAKAPSSAAKPSKPVLPPGHVPTLAAAQIELAARAERYLTIPTGEVFEEDNRKYKFAETGAVDAAGAPKRIKVDVTGQIMSPNAAPTPRREHIALISAQHASDTVDAGAGGSRVGQLTAAHMLLSGGD